MGHLRGFLDAVLLLWSLLAWVLLFYRSRRAIKTSIVFFWEIQLEENWLHQVLSLVPDRGC